MATTQVLHVSNISPFATKEQVQMLFSYVGRIEDFKIYPSDLSLVQTNQQPKFAYIKFEDERGVEVGQHLTNTVFLDRALVCIPAQSNTIPDEETAMQSGVTALPGQRQLPPHISNQLQDMGEGQQMIVTVDPNLAALGLPAYPPLPPTTEPAKVEEIRRTIYVGNLPKGADGEELVNFFNACIGEVMYLRMAAGNDYLPCDYAYVEFSQQSSVPLALQNSDTLEFQGHPLRIQHSKVAIIKPQRKTADQALEEVEEAIKSGSAPGMAEIARGYSPSLPGVPRAPRAVPTSPRASTQRSRSKEHPSEFRSSSRSRRSRSRSRTRHSRSRRRSRTRSPSRSRSPSRRRRHSRSRRRSSSRDRKRSRSSRRRSRSRDKERKKSSKRSRSRDRKDKDSKASKRDRDRSKERDKDKKDGSSSKKDKERERDKDKDKEKKERKRSRSPRDKKRDKDEEKSAKKSKKDRTSGDQPQQQPSPAKKAKHEPHTPPSTRSDASMETATPEKAATTAMAQVKMEEEEATTTATEPTPATVATEATTEAATEGEEESLRERLLERVKLKQQKSDD